MPKQAKKSDRGFTLIELMVVLVIIGVIAAIASPIFISLLSRYRLNGALQQLLGAVNETQRLAMSQGRSCRIDINTSTKIITADPGCLLSNRRINDGITIRSNFTGSTNITFSYKGNTTRAGTIVLSSDYTDYQRCFVIALGTGIKRIGNYEGSRVGRVSRTHCETI